VALKMTNREVDGVSVMELDRHIVLDEPRSSAERSPMLPEYFRMLSNPSRIDAKRGHQFLEPDFWTARRV
jgi:hypothetical protein